jgi:aryl sulfotransferase
MKPEPRSPPSRARRGSPARLRRASDVPEPPRNIVWIASYPKSGNTWVRFLACNLLYGRQDSAAALSALVPDMHESAPAIANSANALLVKTHYALGAAMPLMERTAAAIYVVRDPADVLVSNFHYSQRSTAAVGAAYEDYVERFIRHRGDPRWSQLGMGSWAENVRSWLAAHAPFPVLRLRYEDLIADPERGCQALAQLLGLDRSPAQVHEAVVNSSFQRMREVEEADIHAQRAGIFYKPYLQAAVDSGMRFMRSGAVGDGAARLTGAQHARLRSAFRPLLGQLGYAAE